MKKFFIALVVLITVAALCVGCSLFEDTADQTKAALTQSIEDNIDLYPVYKRLSTAEREAYVAICAAIRNSDESTTALYKCNSRSEARAFGKTMTSLYREIVYEQSELFWVNPYKSELLIKQNGDVYTVYLKPDYIVEKEQVPAMQKQFEEKLEAIVDAATAQPTEFDKIRYVYDEILKRCYYGDDIADSDQYETTAINAYGCLVEGKTICSGYAMAFDAVMKRLGYECGVEFNNYNDFSILTGHVWNYCKIEGDYYYFDLTWDDTGFDSEFYRSYFGHSYNYFAISKEELSQSNFTLTEEAPTPPCNGTKYNYFIHNGYNFSEYDFAKVKDAVLKQKSQRYAVLRFDSYAALLQAESELLDNGKIRNILPDIDGVRYVVAKSNRHLYLFF